MPHCSNCKQSSNLVDNFYDKTFLVVPKKVATCARFALPARLVWLCIKIWRFTLFQGSTNFHRFREAHSPLLYKICAGANFRVVMGCFNEVIWRSRTVSVDKDSISEPSAAQHLHTATYHSPTPTLASNCRYSGLLLTISLRIRLLDLAATTVFTCT